MDFLQNQKYPVLAVLFFFSFYLLLLLIIILGSNSELLFLLYHARKVLSLGSITLFGTATFNIAQFFFLLIFQLTHNTKKKKSFLTYYQNCVLLICVLFLIYISFLFLLTYFFFFLIIKYLLYRRRFVIDAPKLLKLRPLLFVFFQNKLCFYKRRVNLFPFFFFFFQCDVFFFPFSNIDLFFDCYYLIKLIKQYLLQKCYRFCKSLVTLYENVYQYSACE